MFDLRQLLHFLFMTCCWFSLSAGAQQAELVGLDLEPRRVTLQSLSAEGVGILDAQGQAKTVALDEVVRMTLSDEPARIPHGQAALRLRDGQVLVGQWQGAGAAEGTLRLLLANEQKLDVPLDDLMSVSLNDDAIAFVREDQDADTLTLSNAEKLSGFVDSVVEGGVMFEIESAKEPILIPFDRIQGISLANRPHTIDPEPGMVCITTSSRQRLILRSALIKKLEKGSLVIEGESVLGYGAKTYQVPVSSLNTIEPVSARHGLTPLSSIGLELESGGEVFGVPMRPRILGEGAIALHAAVRLAFDLPEGARRVAFTVGLDLDSSVPEARRLLAGCELYVFDGETEIAKHALEPDSEPVRINLPLRTDRLHLELRPATNGPVLDRVRIDDAQVLIERG